MGIHHRNLVTAKSLDQIKIEGVSIDWERHDGNVRILKIADAKGNMITIKASNTYSESLAVLIPEPPKFEDRWVLSGTVANIAIRKPFRYEHEANTARDQFPSNADLTVQKASLPVGDNGEEIAPPPDEIPF